MAEYNELQNSTVPDNTDLSGFEGVTFCISTHPWNGMPNFLGNCKKMVLRSCPRFRDLQALSNEEFFQEILNHEFRDGVRHSVYVRDLNLDDEQEHALGIRPLLLPGSYLTEYLPVGRTMLFLGRVRGKNFIVTAAYLMADAEQLSYEAVCDMIRYDDSGRVHSNRLYELLEKSESLLQYTKEHLQDWKEYLSWREEIVSRQIQGCKYFDINVEKGKLVFSLVCDSEESFKRFRRYLHKGIMAFPNGYSTERWRFNFNMDLRGGRNRNAEGEALGRRGVKVLNAYYMHGSPPLDGELGLSIEEATSREIETYYEGEKHIEDNGDNIDEDADESGDIDYSSRDKEEVGDSFHYPYIAKVAFELSSDDQDRLEKLVLDEEDVDVFIEDHIKPKYPESGFLALSAAGDFVLIRRFQRAVRQFEHSEGCYSPNLPLWLFNVRNARLPVKGKEEKIEKWLSPAIANNENQRLAVEKMLAAPDLCLVQGPPGTGKTTVIAEAVYQFVSRGNRVLLASQSNDAVDNALERLSHTPIIRAVRLVGKQRAKKQNLDDGETGSQYGEDKALGQYYDSLAVQAEQKWLYPWEKLEKDYQNIGIDERDILLFAQDLQRLQDELERHASLRSDLTNKLQAVREKWKISRNQSEVQDREKQQCQLLSIAMKATAQDFYLSEHQLRLVADVLNPILTEAEKHGIKLAPAHLNLDVLPIEQANQCLSLMLFNWRMLSGIIDKMELAARQGTNEARAVRQAVRRKEIEERKKEIIKQLTESELSDLMRKKLQDEYRHLNQAELDENGPIGEGLSKDEENMLDPKVREQILQTPIVFKEIVINVSKGFQTAMEKVLQKLKTSADSYELTDFNAFAQQEKILTGQLHDQDNVIKEITNKISQREATQGQLAVKYKCSPQSGRDEILIAIRNQKVLIERERYKQVGVRDVWQPFLKKFVKRLHDKDSLEYDQKQYRDIYIRSCNVVGMSCTADSRLLSQWDFEDFDVVIIDEVSKATPPELLLALMRGGKAILVGDHRQLPPMFEAHEKSYREIIEQTDAEDENDELLTLKNFTRFEKMVTSSLFKEYFEQADVSIKHSLVTQYRMHSDIMNVINRFYEGRLRSGLTTEQEAKEKAHGLTIKAADGSSFIVPEKHAYWIDSSWLGDKAMYENYLDNTTSARNIYEAVIAVELVKKIGDAYLAQGYGQKGHTKKTVGIISFYLSQVNEIRSRMRILRQKKCPSLKAIDVDVNTVDRFQGKEKNIIIASLVRNNKDQRASRYVAAFERINVAFSRAQEMLLIIGSERMYDNIEVTMPKMDVAGTSTVPVYHYILEDLKRKGGFMQADKALDEASIKLVHESYAKE